MGIITYFVADIINRSKIETLTTQHIVEIEDINSKNENFTNYYLQGSIKMDSAREVREVGNYYFDFALLLGIKKENIILRDYVPPPERSLPRS